MTRPLERTDGTVLLARLDRMGQRRRGERLPAVTGDGGDPGHDAPDRWLVQADVDDRVGFCPEPGVDVLLGLGDGDVRPLLGPDRHGDVEALVVLFDPDVVDPGVVVDFGPLQHPEHRAHGAGVEHHGPGQAGSFGDHLHVTRGGLLRPDDELDALPPAPAGRG